MKKIFKLVAVLTAFAVAGFGLAACSDDDDDDVTYNLIKSTTDTAVVATYEATVTGVSDYGYPASGKDILYCYADNTWKEDVIITMTDGSKTATAMYTAYSGTYTISSGDVTNGTVSIVITKKYEPNDDFTELTEKASSGSQSITISNGKFTLFGTEFTKQ